MFGRKSKSGEPAVAVRKRPLDIYSLMLLLAFVAVSIASVLLWLRLKEYGEYPWWTG